MSCSIRESIPHFVLAPGSPENLLPMDSRLLSTLVIRDLRNTLKDIYPHFPLVEMPASTPSAQIYPHCAAWRKSKQSSPCEGDSRLGATTPPVRPGVTLAVHTGTAPPTLLSRRPHSLPTHQPQWPSLTRSSAGCSFLRFTGTPLPRSAFIPFLQTNPR